MPRREAFSPPPVFDFCLWGAVTAAAKAQILFLKLQIGGFDDVGEDLDIAVDLLAELLAGTAAGIDRHSLELVAHPWVSHCAAQLRTEFVGDRRRGARRNK